jgi:hypothetical protein
LDGERGFEQRKGGKREEATRREKQGELPKEEDASWEGVVFFGEEQT